MPELVPDDRLELVAAADLQQATRHRDVRMQRVGAGRERIRIGVVHDPDPGSRDTGRNGHLLDHVDQLLFLRIGGDRKSTRLNSSHSQISYAVFCLKKKTTTDP